MTADEATPKGPSPPEHHGPPDARPRIETEYDAIVDQLYRAAAGMQAWTVPLARIAEASTARTVTLAAIDKRTGAVIFGYSGGPRPVEAVTEYIRSYHQIDPRLALFASSPVGRWFACQDHFDEAFVARDPFYQNFLLRYGSRFAYGAKLLEDEATMVLLSHHRPPGNPLVSSGERAMLRRLGDRVVQALSLQRELGIIVDRDALGYALLDRLHQPVMLLDRDRNILFRSEAAKAILDRTDVLCELNGVLVCRNGDSDVALTLALRELDGVSPDSPVLSKAPEMRRTLRLRSADGSRMMIATLVALRPVAGTINRTSRALLVIHEPKATPEIEPSFLVAVFRFTPAEARVAARLTSGLTLEEIATEFKISVTTVRTHLGAIFHKTGTHRQAELARLLVAVTSL